VKGLVACRTIDDPKALLSCLQDASSRSQGYIIALTDKDFIDMLKAKPRLDDEQVEAFLHRKCRDLLA
jgi:hypothetical protein